MTFPFYFHLFGLRFHPHPTMELLAYATGLTLHYLRRRRARTPPIALALGGAICLALGQRRYGYVTGLILAPLVVGAGLLVLVFMMCGGYWK